MKKVLVLLLAIVLPVSVNAASTNVTKLELSNDKTVITFKGEIEDDSVAVMCKLYDSKNEEIDLLSTSVSENKFEGTFTISNNDTYKVACANYDGGEIKAETIKVDDIVNPKTGDLIESYCIVLALCVAALILACMAPKFLKKRKNAKISASTKTSGTKKKATTKKSTTKKTSKK